MESVYIRTFLTVERYTTVMNSSERLAAGMMLVATCGHVLDVWLAKIIRN
jgi:hypothetical protein